MRLARWTARAAGAALVGFHVWLLAAQWSGGRLLNDPALLMRWAAALVLAGALLWLSRDGHSFGLPRLNRRTVVIWLLAALLHAPAIANRAGDANRLQTVPETAASLLIQSAAISGLLAISFGALWLLAGLVRRRAAATTAWSFIHVLTAFASLGDGFSLVVSARPPPAHN